MTYYEALFHRNHGFPVWTHVKVRALKLHPFSIVTAQLSSMESILGNLWAGNPRQMMLWDRRCVLYKRILLFR